MIRGIRGATTVDHDQQESIVNATFSLLEDMIEKNNIDPEDTASVFISTTDDINSVFPAKALRKLEGWEYVPVMCMSEIPVKDALPFCIRVMVHVNTPKKQKEIQHVYHHEAVKLRPDLVGANRKVDL
ncbi:chorismate mutase [Jeotgalibacillus haloalkalitolerans]|uniref:chorismate mutase n=1 Tax=Jeotgalibacillus haloalkalitolerans TaxID=3104292 RepID=A0ABU5KL93_9BACL|nr:chorismate mutase [Jeotgalibacillus sp. HH7-29]MDZ5712008.1 chorismate mutase [Jeotgalibacillus sp. HH7-29]